MDENTIPISTIFRECERCGAEFPVTAGEQLRSSVRRFCSRACRYSPDMDVRRFWKQVNKDGPIPAHVPELGNCWVWSRPVYYGYGLFSLGKRQMPAHRASWMLAHGPIPELPGADFRGTCVCHRCDNRACVRPEHLFLGTHLDNMRDMNGKGRDFRGSPPSGERHGASRLTASIVADIRARCASGQLQREVGALYGVRQSQISRIVLGKRWKQQ